MGKWFDNADIIRRANVRAQELANVNAARYFQVYAPAGSKHNILAPRHDRHTGRPRSFTLSIIERAAEILQTTPAYLLGYSEQSPSPLEPQRMETALEVLADLSRGNLRPAQGWGAIVCELYELIGELDKLSPGVSSTPDGRSYLGKLVGSKVGSINSTGNT